MADEMSDEMSAMVVTCACFHDVLIYNQSLKIMGTEYVGPLRLIERKSEGRMFRLVVLGNAPESPRKHVRMTSRTNEVY